MQMYSPLPFGRVNLSEPEIFVAVRVIVCAAFVWLAMTNDAKASVHVVPVSTAVADNDDSPVALYDTTSGGWMTGGGQAVAAAIIAAMLALGGAPAAGSSPAAYLYAHPGLFNDITTGSNGTCAPSPA